MWNSSSNLLKIYVYDDNRTNGWEYKSWRDGWSNENISHVMLGEFQMVWNSMFYDPYNIHVIEYLTMTSISLNCVRHTPNKA